MFGYDENVMKQHDAVAELVAACYEKRVNAIRNGAPQDELIMLALEVDVLTSKASFLLNLAYGDTESPITHEISWYDERGLFVATDYRQWLNEDVGGIPRWLANLNAV